MSEFNPVSTVSELDLLDQDDILAGYRAGLHGDTREPGSDKSRGYWHGWRNAMVDRRLAPADAHQCALAQEAVRKWKAH